MLLCGMLWITGRCSKCVSGSPIQFGIKRGVWGQRIGEVPKGWIVYPAKMSLVLGIRKSTILDPSKDSVLLFALKEVAKLWRIVGQTGRYEKFSGILCANNWWLSFRNMVGHYGGRTGSALIMKFNSSQNFDYVRRSVTKVSEDYRGPIRQRLIARFFPHLNRDDEQMGSITMEGCLSAISCGFGSVFRSNSGLLRSIGGLFGGGSTSTYEIDLHKREYDQTDCRDGFQPRRQVPAWAGLLVLVVNIGCAALGGWCGGQLIGAGHSRAGYCACILRGSVSLAALIWLAWTFGLCAGCGA